MRLAGFRESCLLDSENSVLPHDLRLQLELCRSGPVVFYK